MERKYDETTHEAARGLSRIAARIRAVRTLYRAGSASVPAMLAELETELRRGAEFCAAVSPGAAASGDSGGVVG